jgi:hypothetical protein
VGSLRVGLKEPAVRSAPDGVLTSCQASVANREEGLDRAKGFAGYSSRGR